MDGGREADTVTLLIIVVRVVADRSVGLITVFGRVIIVICVRLRRLEIALLHLEPRNQRLRP